MLNHFEALAMSPRPADRARLIDDLTVLYFRLAEAERAVVLELYEDVVCRVLDEIDEQRRAHLSHRVALAPDMPKGVLHRLASDEAFDVAAPVLRHAASLDDRDLITLVETVEDAHRVAIAGRVFVSERVSDALIDLGGLDVRRAVAANDGAQITDRGYERLAEHALDDRVLRELVASRAELPTAVRERLVPIIAAEVRRRAHPMPDDDPDYRHLREAVEDGELTLDAALLVALGHDRHDRIVDLIAAAGPYGRAPVMAAMLDRDPLKLAVFMRAAGASADIFRRVLDLRARGLGVGSNAPRHVKAYLAIEPEAARATLSRIAARLAA